MQFSAIIPAFQCQNTIEKTVMSIMKSGIKDYEIIIIDDGSSDLTPDICIRLSNTYKQIKYFRQNNQGVSAARNKGLKIAKGQYILFFDSDDTVDEEAFIDVMNIVEKKNPDLFIFGMSFDYYRGDKLYKRNILFYPNEQFLDCKGWGEIINELYKYNALTPVWNKVYKKEIIEKNNIQFNSNLFLMEDFLFVLEFLKYCKKLYIFPKDIYRYNQPEKEGNAYKRLEKIFSINEFMESFEESMKALNLANRYITDGEKILTDMYYMLLEQKLYKLDIKKIQNIRLEFLKSRYCDEKICFNLPLKYKKLRKNLLKDKCINIWLNNQKNQLKHKIAVKIKYYFS